MAYDFAADLAHVYDTDVFAEAAILTHAAGGAVEPCTVILDRPGRDVGLGGVGLVLPSLTGRVRVAELTRAPVAGDVLQVGGTLYKVKKAPLNDDGREYLLDLAG